MNAKAVGGVGIWRLVEGLLFIFSIVSHLFKM